MGHCLFVCTGASGITIIFATPLNQIGFAEAHHISHAILANLERPYIVRARESNSCGLMTNLFCFSARCLCHMDRSWLCGWML